MRTRTRSAQEELVSEANRILRDDLYSGKKVLDHLETYQQKLRLIDEESADSSMIFTPGEIRAIAIAQRLRFLESHLYKPEIPPEARQSIVETEIAGKTELRGLMILAFPEAFRDPGDHNVALIFAPTSHGNYYLIHRWGKKPRWTRSLLFWPMRRFETLALTVIFFTLAVTLLLPTWVITLDAKATYWSGYRAAAFMHLFIFNAGITAYLTFAFSRNFSSTVWNRLKDFD